MTEPVQNRRLFLSTLGLAGTWAACGGGSPGDGGGDALTGPSSSPVFASFTDDLRDLLTGEPIPSGQIIVPERPAIEVRDGRFTVDASHRLVVGTSYPDVRIEANPAVPRQTSVIVASGGREAIGAYAWGTVPESPPSAGEAFGMIQYHRKIGHRAQGVPDYQD